MHRGWRKISRNLSQSACHAAASAALMIGLMETSFCQQAYYRPPVQPYGYGPVMNQPTWPMIRQTGYYSPYRQQSGDVFSGSGDFTADGQYCPPGSMQPYSGQPSNSGTPSPSTQSPSNQTPSTQTPSNPTPSTSPTPSPSPAPSAPPAPAPSAGPSFAQSEASSAARGPDAAPGMIGDFFGGAAGNDSFIPLIYGPGGFLAPEGLVAYVPKPGDSVGRIKFSENNSALPRDRFIMDYTSFDRVKLNSDPIDVHRYTPGFEKTFFDGNASIDVRLPFATTLNSNFEGAVVPVGGVDTATSITDTSSAELGDLSLTAKFLLYQDQNWVYSAGVQGTLPTADDVRVYETGGAGTVELFRIDNKSYHVMPFWAAQYQVPNSYFMQFFVQGDFDATGSPVSLAGVNQVDRPKDTPFLYLDYSLGYWVYRDQPVYRKTWDGRTVHVYSNASPLKLTGFAPRVELHYNKALDSTREIVMPSLAPGEDYFLGANLKSIDILNLTLGASCFFGANKELAVAWGTPLTGGAGEEFESEFRVMFNYFLGPAGRTSPGSYPQRY